MLEAACKAPQASLVAARPGPQPDELTYHLGAMTSRVVVHPRWRGSTRPWPPHMEARAEGAAGRLPVAITRSHRLGAVRRLISAYPLAEWQDARTADLRTVRMGGETS